MLVIKKVVSTVFIVFLAAVYAPGVWAQGIYEIEYEDVEKAKDIIDDPSPVYKKLPLKNIINYCDLKL